MEKITQGRENPVVTAARKAAWPAKLQKRNDAKTARLQRLRAAFPDPEQAKFIEDELLKNG